MPPRARGIGAAWGGKIGVSYRRIKPRDDGHIACSGNFGLGPADAAPLFQHPMIDTQILPHCCFSSHHGTLDTARSGRSERDVGKIHNEIASAFADTIALVGDSTGFEIDWNTSANTS